MVGISASSVEKMAREMFSKNREIREVFFAERATKYKWIDKNENYTVKNGGKVSNVEDNYKKKFAKELKEETIKNIKGSVSDGVNALALKAGNVVKVAWKEKVEDGYEYKKTQKVKIKRKIYVVATCTADNGKLNIEIHENKLSNANVVYDGAVKFLDGGAEKSKITFDLQKSGDNVYAKEIILAPQKEEDLKKLVKKFNDRTDKNAFLFCKAEVSDCKDNVVFPNDTKEFLNKDGERLEIIGTPCFCNCDIEVEEMIDLIYCLRDKQGYKTFRESFFNLKTEYISSIRITDGAINENRDKIKLFTDEMNAMFKKFNINTCKRKIHFIGQMYLETDSFRATYEGQSTTSVPSNYRGGYDFQGRGMKQITHNYNYLAYYDYVNGTTHYKTYDKYRSITEASVETTLINSEAARKEGLTQDFYNNTLKPFAKNLSTNLFHAFNSAGWFSTQHRGSTLTAMDKGLENSNIKDVTKAINGGENNLTERQNYTKWTKDFFKYDTECINK